MSSADDPSEAVRQDMIKALEDGKWEFTKRALREGLDAFRRHEDNPTDEAMIDYILDLLQTGFPLSQVDLHDDPGGEGHVMKDTDGQGLYVKLKFDWPYVIVMSFHY
jgi:hypothetical protein